jgi:hypothetical protein
MPDFSITISANTVAWYAAIVATISLLVTFYNAWKDRARIRISINSNMQIRNVSFYSPQKTYIDIAIRNRGRRPVKISTVALKLYRTRGFFLLNDSVHQHMPRVLTEEEPRTNFFVEQNLVAPERIEYAVVHDEAGNMYIKYARPSAIFRRFVSRWIRNIDNRAPPSPANEQA